MDLRQIEYFVSLYEDGNVTRAARRLNVVQPALSMQIAKLETEFGQKLFERTSQGMVPTAAGRTMYRLFLPVLRELAHARQQMTSFGGQISGRVSVGLLTSVTHSVLSDSLARFAADYPEVEVSVAEGYTTTFVDWVTSGQLDMAVINLPRRTVGLTVEEILEEELVLVTGSGTTIPVASPVSFADLPRLKLVIPSKRHGLRGIIDSHAEAEGVDLAPRLEIDAIHSIADLVRKSDWVTVLPAIGVFRGLADGSLRAHRIVAPRIVRKLALIHHPRRALTPAARKLAEVMAVDLVRAASALEFSDPAGVS
ncbi:MAG TPA: LysR family transcriptional regulator [Stellaceae bacterium]|nr:LysR family transcriptional regulator [Stellaceae bacterium]